MRKPVILIPAFGGAAQEAWNLFRRYYTDDEAKLLQTFDEKDATWANNVIKMIEGFVHRSTFSKKGIIISSIIAVLSMVGWVYLFSILNENMHTKQLVIWSLLACASICGSTFRIILRYMQVFQSRLSIVHPALSVVAGLLLGFGFILLAQGTNLSLNGETIRLTGLEDMQRVSGMLSLLLFSCSLFFEAAWENLSKKLDDYFNK